MTKLFEVYNCEVCGNMTKVVHASGGTMVCCSTLVITPSFSLIISARTLTGIFMCSLAILIRLP